ncbi:BLUF domain-containing protein [Piscinibacter sakaiensis]|uniref:BLUF domain-containing protein n=1 Tax=Piscinibacter sakaiensis TaxID=1547922 RepID=UPI003AADB2B6
MNSCLLYISALAPDVGAEVVAPITRSARRNNLRDGVTGLLVFDGALFLQWVEGPTPAIEALLGRLRADRRHGKLDILMLQTWDAAPLFPDWQLAFHVVDPQLQALCGFSGLEGTAALQRLRSLLPSLDLEPH